MGKRIISVLLIVGICLSVTACSPVENLFDIMNRVTDNDNPLSGKSPSPLSLSNEFIAEKVCSGYVSSKDIIILSSVLFPQMRDNMIIEKECYR